MAEELKPVDGAIGVDLGTQECTALLMDEKGKVLGVGVHGGYPMVGGLPEGYKEQRPREWRESLRQAMNSLRADLAEKCLKIGVVYGVCITGQMHGEVVLTAEDVWNTARLWCDVRNPDWSKILTDFLRFKMPVRITASRFAWTTNNQPEKAKACIGLTTPAGYLTEVLCGQRKMGLGEASGMFPIDSTTGDYDAERLELYDILLAGKGVRPLRELLPRPVAAGNWIGRLNGQGAELMGLPEGTPVAPPEGDQPAALAGSYIDTPGLVSCSAGTSICDNALAPVGKMFEGVHPAIDHYCTASGKPFNMAWIKNGTVMLNWVVDAIGRLLGFLKPNGDVDRGRVFALVIPEAAKLSIDCGGLFACPLMDTDPCVELLCSAAALRVAVPFFTGMTPGNAHLGNLINAAFQAGVFNSRIGLEELRGQGFPLDEVVVTGGIVKSKEHFGPMIADCLRTRVRCLEAAEEGTAFGGALLPCARKQTATQLGGFPR